MQRPLRPPSAVATGSDVWQRIAHRRGQNHEDIHLPATTPAQCDAAHDPCRVQGRQAHAWRLRRGAVARDPADPRQAKKAARGLMLRCGTWRARASKSTRASTEEGARRSLKKHVCAPVFGAFLRTPHCVTVYGPTRVNPSSHCGLRPLYLQKKCRAPGAAGGVRGQRQDRTLQHYARKESLDAPPDFNAACSSSEPFAPRFPARQKTRAAQSRGKMFHRT